MVSIMYNPIPIYILHEGRADSFNHSLQNIFLNTSSPLNFNLVSEQYIFPLQPAPPLLFSVFCLQCSVFYSIYNQHSSIMDPTALQSASLQSAPLQSTPPLTTNTQSALPANSPILQSASGFSMAPPPGFFAPSSVHSLGCSFPLTMAAIPSSAPTISTHLGLPSAASIVPNTHLHGAAVVPLSNTHQVISLKLTNNNYLYWRMQMKPYLLGQGVYAFVDGSYPCPALCVATTETAAPAINSFFLSWKQQDQLIMSALLSSLSTEILHLVVDCDTSHSIW